MSRRRILIVAPLVILGLVLLAAGAVWFARPKSLPVTLIVSGTHGLAFNGTAQVDGTSRELTGTVPAQLPLEGARVIFSLSTPDDSGEMNVKAALGDVVFGSRRSMDPPRYAIRGWVQSGWAWSPPRTWIENFDPNQDPGWAVTPP